MKFLEERAHRPQGDFAYFMHIKKKRVCTRKSGSAAQQKTGCIRGIPGYVYQCPIRIEPGNMTSSANAHQDLIPGLQAYHW